MNDNITNSNIVTLIIVITIINNHNDYSNNNGCLILLAALLHLAPDNELAHVVLKRQTFIHIHQSIFTVSNSSQVYCTINNWCIWINISCVVLLLEVEELADVRGALGAQAAGLVVIGEARDLLRASYTIL